MSRNIQQFLQALVDARVLSTGESAAMASALTPEQRQSDATKFARRLVELKKLTQAQAAAALQPPSASAPAPPANDDLSVMLGIQPLRGVTGRTAPGETSTGAIPAAAAHAADDDGLSMMLGNKPLRSLATPKPEAAVVAAPGPTGLAADQRRSTARSRLPIILAAAAAAAVLLAGVGWWLTR